MPELMTVLVTKMRPIQAADGNLHELVVLFAQGWGENPPVIGEWPE